MRGTFKNIQNNKDAVARFEWATYSNHVASFDSIEFVNHMLLSIPPNSTSFQKLLDLVDKT